MPLNLTPAERQLLLLYHADITRWRWRWTGDAGGATAVLTHVPEIFGATLNTTELKVGSCSTFPGLCSGLLCQV